MEKKKEKRKESTKIAQKTMFLHTPLYKHGQNEREIVQWRLLGWVILTISFDYAMYLHSLPEIL